MTELVQAQHWKCPWCKDYLPDSPLGTAIDHIIPRVYGGPHRRWNLQLLHQECNSAKGSKITAEALKVLSVESSVKSRTSFGGTAPKNVAAQAKAWAKRLEKERKLG